MGAIAAQDWCHIRPDDTPRSLWERELAPMGLGLFKRVLADIETGILTFIPQDGALATWEPAFSTKRLVDSV